MLARFKWVANDDEGRDGWLIQGRPGEFFDPTGARGAAHDLMEHFPGGDAGPQDECLALGAYLRNRLWPDWEGRASMRRSLYRGQSFEAQIATDLAQELLEPWRAYQFESAPLPDAPAHAFRPLRHDVEKALKLLADNAYQSIASDDGFEDTDWPEGHKEEARAALRRFVNNAVAWVREGWRRYGRRYRGHDSYDVWELMNRVTRAIEEVRGPDEGTEIVVRVNVKRMNVSVSRKDPWEGQEFDDE